MSIGGGKQKTVGIIIIGDEVLKGQVADANIHFLCREFYALGVKVVKVSVIGDDLEQIASEVRQFSDSFDFVVTTGGIGPTHDDVTYQGVARAFGDSLQRNAQMEETINRWLGPRGYSREVTMRMAQMPSRATLIFDRDKHLASFPVVSLANVFVFPGIPTYLRKLFPRLRAVFQGEAVHSGVVHLAQDELSVVPGLDEAVNK